MTKLEEVSRALDPAVWKIIDRCESRKVHMLLPDHQRQAAELLRHRMLKRARKAVLALKWTVHDAFTKRWNKDIDMIAAEEEAS